MDSDGSIHRMSKKDFNLIRINFTNYNRQLLTNTRIGFIELGFSPSKIIRNRVFYISKKLEIIQQAVILEIMLLQVLFLSQIPKPYDLF